MKIPVFYRYLYPDDVVSSEHISDLCEGLIERDWEVTGYGCNRKRIWRPGFHRSTSLGCFLNSVWAISMRSIERAYSNDRTKREPWELESAWLKARASGPALLTR
jgi:hypothetical protein